MITSRLSEWLRVQGGVVDKLVERSRPGANQAQCVAVSGFPAPDRKRVRRR